MRHFGGPFVNDGGPSWVHWLFLFLIVVAVVAGVLLVVRMWAERPRTPQGWRGGGPPPPPSPAISELDLRYARGEIGREEYLQRRADLLGYVAPPAQPGPPGTPGSPPHP